MYRVNTEFGQKTCLSAEINIPNLGIRHVQAVRFSLSVIISDLSGDSSAWYKSSEGSCANPRLYGGRHYFINTNLRLTDVNGAVNYSYSR